MRILIIRPDKIGDLILTLPIATAIKSSMPDAHVAFLLRDYTAPLIELATDVDETIIYNRDLSLRKTISLIHDSKPDAVFVFGHKLKLSLASFFAGVPVRVGRAYFWFSFLYNKKIREHRKNAERNEAEYNVRMLNAIGIDTKETPLPKLDKTKLPPNPIAVPFYVVFHIPTGGSAPHWSQEHYIQLAVHITQKYHYKIILSGVPEEYQFLSPIAERMKHNSCDVHIHTTGTLAELAAMLASAKLVVSGSTGPGHLAAALGTPTIGIFPGVQALSKERWGFRGLRAKNLSPPVLPRKECPMCKDCICINEITSEQVEHAITELNIF